MKSVSLLFKSGNKQSSVTRHIYKRTLRSQVQQYVSYTARGSLVEQFTPSNEEQESSGLVADYLR